MSGRVLDELRGISIRCDGATPFLIAPAADISESNNALAISYAQWLSHELGWPVCETVFQSRTAPRDKLGAWYRMAHRVEFYGEIDNSAPYVIVDDVVTMGGTMADLRAFIHRKGGRVIAMSAIASRDGLDKQIRLDGDAVTSLERRYGPNVGQLCSEIFGFDHTCFTEDEGRKVAGCEGHDELRKNILRARNASDASGSSRTAARSA